MTVTETAPAKLNLSLHVVGRREDGYHLLESLVAFAAFGDVVTVSGGAPGSGLSLALSGPFAAALNGEADNLVLRAARLLLEAAGTRTDLAITLDKRLPVASGIGGGSTDAAATLRAVSRHLGLSMMPEQVHAIAVQLGADVPVCLNARPALMRGVGEQVLPLPALPALPLLLVNPGLPLATPPVFKARTGPFSKAGDDPLGAVTAALAAPDPAAGFLEHLRGLGNDLTDAAASQCPQILQVLGRIASEAPAAPVLRMSGSGATCFALFGRGEDAACVAAARAIAQKHPGWWVVPTTLGT